MSSAVFAEALADLYADIGIAAAWTPVTGAGGDVLGKFRSPYAAVDLGAVAIGGNRPTFEASIDCLCAIGDQLSIPEEGNFKIVDRRNDAGKGKAVLVLESA